MEQIVKEFGGFFIDGIVLVLLLILVFTGLRDENGNVGAFGIVGANLEIENMNYSVYTDFSETYKMESEKNAPQIKYSGSNLKAGVNKMSDHIKAVDYEGKALIVRVISIKSPDGREIIDSYNQDTTEISLNFVGVYGFTVVVSDDINQSLKATIQIPVNK